MTQHQAVTPFDTRNDMGREHSLHCFACGGAVGTRTCTCLSYPSVSRDTFANALAWAYRDGVARATQSLSLTVETKDGQQSAAFDVLDWLRDNREAILDRLQSLSLPVDIDRSGLAQEVDDISYAGAKP